MENFIPEQLMTLISISIVFSVILMSLIQKCKSLSWISTSWHVWFLNLFLSFFVGIPFGMTFYDLSLSSSAWVGLFGFIGAPTLYQALKSQNIVNYHPTSVSDTVTLSKKQEIPRNEE